MMSLSFILTEKCTWTCNYCRFSSLENQSSTTIEIIDKHLPYIKDVGERIPYAGFHIQGAEPGSLDRETLVYFLKELNQKVLLSTNGLFFEKGYHLDSEIMKHVRLIYWHLCETPGDFKMEKDYDYHYYEAHVVKGIVHHNIDDMIAFVKRNAHMDIGFIEYACDITKKRTITKNEHEQLYEAIKDIPNVTDEGRERIELRINEAENLRYMCQNYHSPVSINLVRETICLCQRSMDTNIELTRENLIKRIQQFPKDVFQGGQSGCDSCVRLYFDKMDSTSVANTLRARKIKF
ncbi:hypothetical protein KAR91_59155 [Candidatus Pacearchaeota archaeon]|nr:hypothetical protein [Candidatus Pacearchaeota archaeon]